MFKQNKQTFCSDDSFQHTYRHTTQLDFGPIAASAYVHFENEVIPDRVWPGGNLMYEKLTAASPNHNSESALGNTADLLTTSSIGESYRPGNSKRPNDDDQSYQLGCKRTRQLDTDKPAFRSTCEQPYASVTAGEDFKSRKDHAVPEDSTKNPHGSIYNFPWFTCSINDEDTKLEAPLQLSSFPGYYEDHDRTAASNHFELTHSPVFDYTPRKLVSLGSNHQADIPALGSKCSQRSTSSGKFLIDENDEKRTKICVMQIPDFSLLDSEGFLVGHGKSNCYCLDEGSIRCVRQHVTEAREKLQVALGQERFLGLGFFDMGEDVAVRWTEEDEQLFCEIVMSNPASVGKNFWDVLPRAFPNRSSKELISYYFNVFMLRKRADQNRCDPLNPDSDNDEWQGSGDGEFETAEEDDDEDSGVESPADDVQNMEGLGAADLHEEAEGEDSDDEECDLSICDLKSKFGSHVQPMEEQDVHDESCTSYDDQQNETEPGVRADALEGMHGSLSEDDHGKLRLEYRNDGINCLSDHEYTVGQCDARPWEIGYTRVVDTDFLPTCNVIEEVFGRESWEKENTEHDLVDFYR